MGPAYDALRAGAVGPAYEDDEELSAKLAAASMLLGMPPPHRRAGVRSTQVALALGFALLGLD